MAAKPQSLYDSYPLPDGGDGVDLEDENDGEVVSAGSLLLDYRATSKDVHRIATYLGTFLAGTAEGSPVTYEDIGVRRGGWHASGDRGCPYLSNVFIFCDHKLQWTVARREKGEVVVPRRVDEYGGPARGPVRTTPEAKEAAPLYAEPPPPRPRDIAAVERNMEREIAHYSRIADAQRAADALPCNMTIALLLEGATAPGYEAAAVKCSYCKRAVACHKSA